MTIGYVDDDRMLFVRASGDTRQLTRLLDQLWNLADLAAECQTKIVALQPILDVLHGAAENHASFMHDADVVAYLIDVAENVRRDDDRSGLGEFANQIERESSCGGCPRPACGF